MPSGILNEKTVCVIGNGVVVHIPSLLKELDALTVAGVNWEGRIKLSDRAHLVFDFHQAAPPRRKAPYRPSALMPVTSRKFMQFTTGATVVPTLPLIRTIFGQELDGAIEKKRGRNKIGTTRKGIGPAYASKIQRNGVRVGELKYMDDFTEQLTALAE